jgi:hypothetical protein
MQITRTKCIKGINANICQSNLLVDVHCQIMHLNNSCWKIQLHAYQLCLLSEHPDFTIIYILQRIIIAVKRHAHECLTPATPSRLWRWWPSTASSEQSLCHQSLRRLPCHVLWTTANRRHKWIRMRWRNKAKYRYVSYAWDSRSETLRREISGLVQNILYYWRLHNDVLQLISLYTLAATQ